MSKIRFFENCVNWKIYFSQQLIKFTLNNPILSQKLSDSKYRILGTNSSKNEKPKNCTKTVLTPLFKELWAILGFVKFKNHISPPPQYSIDNPAVFCHFWGHKYTSKSIDFSIFGRHFRRIFDILSYRWVF